MSTRHIMRSAAWLLAVGFGLTAACGDSGSGDDDDDLPTSSVGNTTTFPATNSTTGSAAATGNNNGFGNNNATSANGTTGNTLDQSNDNCEDIEPVDGEPCDDDGLFCMAADGLGCSCGGSDRFPDGVWTCRGALGSGGAPNAGGAAGENAGGAAGENAGGENAGGADSE